MQRHYFYASKEPRLSRGGFFTHFFSEFLGFYFFHRACKSQLREANFSINFFEARILIRGSYFMEEICHRNSL